jgi:hypothetical protein
MEHQGDDDVIHVYQEQIEEHKKLTIPDRPRLIELVTCDIELMEEEEQGPPKKHLRKSHCIIERKQRRERLNTHVSEADSDTDDF